MESGILTRGSTKSGRDRSTRTFTTAVTAAAPPAEVMRTSESTHLFLTKSTAVNKDRSSTAQLILHRCVNAGEAVHQPLYLPLEATAQGPGDLPFQYQVRHEYGGASYDAPPAPQVATQEEQEDSTSDEQCQE